jgi:ABC-type uncharacterized transport system substrate-binding protein
LQVYQGVTGMQGICSLPRTTLHCALLVFAVTFAGCTAWLPVDEPDELEPIVVTKTPPPDLGPLPEPEPEPVVQVPETRTLAPIAILLTSSQPAYLDVAAELAGHFENHTVYDLSEESSPPVVILRSINDSDSAAVVAIGLGAAQSSVSMSDLPVVFSQVFNHQQYDLLNDNSRGVAALAPMEAQLAAWKQVDPTISQVGVIIGEGHDELLEAAQNAADKHDIELNVRIAHSDQETLYLFRRMLTDIDGFWLFPDNRILSARVLNEMLRDANRHSVTVVVPNEAMLQIGAAISISTVAADIAATIAKVLHRIQAGEMDQVPPITELSEVRVTINDEILNKQAVAVTGKKQ